jgi:O-antigen/teichoic acid export membrane protein
MSATTAPSLRRNVGWVLAGNLVYAGCQWGMLVALARLGTPALLGEFALALALTAPLFVLATLSMRTAQATDQRHEFDFADYAQLRLLCLAGAILLLATVLAVGGFAPATAATIALVGVAKACDAFSDVVYGLLQQHERMRRVGVSRVLQGSLQLLALCTALAATGSVVMAAAAMAAVSIGVTVAYDLTSARRIAGRAVWRPVVRRRPSWRTLRRLLLLSLPLGVAGALDSLNASVPRYALDAYGSRADLGYYAAIAYFLIGQGTVLVAVVDAARPRLARAFLSSRDDFARLLRQLALVAIAAGLLGVLIAVTAGAELLHVLYGPDYATQATLLVWIMVAAIPWNLAGVLGSALAAGRRFAALSASFFVMTGATALASLWLVPAHGALGAAWALGLGMLARLATSAVLLWRVWRDDALPADALGASAS